MTSFSLIPITTVCTLKPQKKESKEILNENDLVSFIPMCDLGICQKYITPTQTKTLKKAYNGYTYFAENDVILAKITPCFENGKLGIARNLKNSVGFGSSEYIVFRTSEKIDSEYLFYYLSQNSFRDLGKKVMTGAVGHKRIPKEFIEALKIPLPSIPEQKRIVAILDETFAAIDQVIANTERNLANAHELFDSYLNEVFTQKGGGWEEYLLGDVCSFLNGFAFKSSDAVDSSNTQLIRMGNLYQNKLDLDRRPIFYPDIFSVTYESFLLNSGDLIMSLTGTVDKEDYGYTVEIPHTSRQLLLNQRIAKIIYDNKTIDKRYFLYLLRSRTFLSSLYSIARGVRQANLSVVNMKQLRISLPSKKFKSKLVM